MSVVINGTNGVTYNDGTIQATAPAQKNKIINGNMLIAQRGTSGTPTAAGNYLACDRWKAWEASDAAVTLSQETDGPTGQFTKCLKYNITTADASIGASQFGMVRQMIEGQNIIDLGFGTASAQSVTISFWVKSSLTGSHGAALNNGNEDRSYPFAYTVSSANTWEYKTVTIAGDTSGTWDTDTTAGMIITFGLGAGTTYQGTADAWQAGNKFQPSGTIQNIGTISNWNVTGVQLEAGVNATDFEQLQYGQQFALCQRYFETSYDYGVPFGTAPAQNGNLTTVSSSLTPTQMAGAAFKVVKRAVPTIVAYNSITGTAGQAYKYNDAGSPSITFAGIGIQGLGRTTLGASAASTYLWHFTADSEL